MTTVVTRWRSFGPKERRMARQLALCTLVCSLLVEGGPAWAKNTPSAPQARPAPQYTAEEAEALGDAADRRAKEQQRRWDHRLKRISGSICDGC